MSDPQTLPVFFMARHGPADATARANAIPAGVATGLGTWLSPSDVDASHRPANHGHEIHLFGVTATGDTADPTVANWFTAATRINTADTGPQVAT